MDLVGREQHDDVGASRPRPRPRRSCKPGCFGLARAARPAAQPDDDVDPAVVEVERLGAALIAVAEDRDALAGERAGSMSASRSRSMAVRLARSRRAAPALARRSPSSGSCKRGHSARRLVREPGILALGVSARRLLAGGDRLVASESRRADKPPSRARRSRASPAGRDRACARAAPSTSVDRALLDHRAKRSSQRA